MSTGQLLFYTGIGLFGLTIILAIVFLIKKPKYNRENTAIGNGQTVPLRNGYPTEPMTIQYGAKDKKSMKAERPTTEAIKPTTDTVVLGQQTVPLEAETECLLNETEMLVQKTGTLLQGTQLLDDKTTPLI